MTAPLHNMIEIKNKHKFALDIERIVSEKQCEYMEALLIYSKENNIEVETIAQLTKQSSVIKAKLEVECHDSNLLKHGAQLPI